MPTLTTTVAQLREYLTSKLSDEQLQDIITSLGTDIEEFGEQLKVEIFPDRPDLLSVPGLARAINTYVKKPFAHNYSVAPATTTVRITKDVASVRPHTRCLIARKVQLTEDRLEQLIDLQEKLHITYGRDRKKVAIGVYPLKDITLPITYTALKPQDIVFTALEMHEELPITQITEQHPTAKKYAHLLEGATRYPVFIDAKNTILSVPPLINSKDAVRYTLIALSCLLK